MAASRPTATTARARVGRPLGAGLAGTAIALALLAGTAAKAHAHAAFLESKPEPGASLERAPRQVALEFTEPLNSELTEVRLVAIESGDAVEAETRVAEREQVVLRPTEELARGAYRIDWYTVSTLDGHPLEGAVGFGVRVPAPSADESVEESPLARQGWLRIAARGVLYGTLFFFAGGVMGAALLSRGRGAAEWLHPAALVRSPGGPDPDAARERAWRSTMLVGWLAAAAAAAVASVETYAASGGLGIADLDNYLLANAAGVARLLTILALLGAVLLADRARGAAGVAIAAALLSIAFSGHANSAEPRALAVASDWIHLLAAAVWVGGIAQIAAAWLPVVRRAPRETRRRAMRSVLGRFGRVALPAFAVVVATGLVNALIQLGDVPALWETAYGRVLAAKILLVGLIALASYGHAIRLRPRLLAANPHPGSRPERRHWRLLSVEPVAGIAVLFAAAALVAFPLPPRQLAETEAESPAACDPCPVPEPKRGELAVAGWAGWHITALWLGPDGVGTVRVYDLQGAAAEVPLRVPGGELGGGCGEGCWRVRAPASADEVTIAIRDGERIDQVAVPARWDPARSEDARRLVCRVQREMRGLTRVRIRERTSSGPAVNTTMALFRSRAHARLMRANFRWAAFASSARWLGTAREGGRRVARVALVDRGAPTWYLLEIDLGSERVLRERLVTSKHLIDRRYSR